MRLVFLDCKACMCDVWFVPYMHDAHYAFPLLCQIQLADSDKVDRKQEVLCTYVEHASNSESMTFNTQVVQGEFYRVRVPQNDSFSAPTVHVCADTLGHCCAILEDFPSSQYNVHLTCIQSALCCYVCVYFFARLCAWCVDTFVCVHIRAES